MGARDTFLSRSHALCDDTCQAFKLIVAYLFFLFPQGNRTIIEQA